MGPGFVKLVRRRNRAYGRGIGDGTQAV